MAIIQRYSVNHHLVETLLTRIKTEEIAIPEIQRPFVWNAAKVRDFIDSLYNGYPVGYLITWRNPNVRLKDGTQSTGKHILIDGQQRMMALLAALLGKQVVNKDYKRTRISIAFHPRKEYFQVANPTIKKDREWIDDIPTVFDSNVTMFQLVDNYCEVNHVADKNKIYKRMERLSGIRNNSLGVIELNSDLEVETVTEIFSRINLQGVRLNAADFAMSKMAAREQYGGHLLRKCIDYFCHLAKKPESYSDLAKDADFASTDYFRAMEWLKNQKDDLYDPSYTDMLRVAFMSQFKRGRLGDLVPLLSGRNFETRTFEEAIAEKAFHKLRDGILSYMRKANFTQFIMILRSAGFVDKSLIGAKNTVNFAYILFLTLRSQREAPERIETLVRRWFVMSILTGRYTGSLETAFDVDIRNIDRQGVSQYLDTIERADLSDVFWEAGLPQQMDTSAKKSPYFNVFLASQVKENDKGFLSHNLTVRDLMEGQKDIHHVFPRHYLQKHGFQSNRYNQIANYVVMQREINTAIGALPPEKYFSELQEQCRNGATRYGGITDADQLQENLAAHCIPEGMDAASVKDYDSFLKKRRELMAAKIRAYYKTL